MLQLSHTPPLCLIRSHDALVLCCVGKVTLRNCSTLPMSIANTHEILRCRYEGLPGTRHGGDISMRSQLCPQCQYLKYVSAGSRSRGNRNVGLCKRRAGELGGASSKQRTPRRRLRTLQRSNVAVRFRTRTQSLQYMTPKIKRRNRFNTH